MTVPARGQHAGRGGEGAQPHADQPTAEEHRDRGGVAAALLYRLTADE
jgi:hypothetical protein